MTTKQASPARPPWLGPPFSPASSGWALLPFRAFVGFTFTFAGLQKLANPEFYDAHNPTSFQAQLKEAATSSPIHFIVSPLQHVAVPLGVVLALGELAVGLGTLLGLWTRIAAVGGILLSLSLFLTVSFHSSPYYTGSDIVFLFAWLPLLVAGSGGVLSVDAYLTSRARTPAGAAPAAERPVPGTGQNVIDRRAFAAAGALGVVLAGLAAGLGRLVGHTSPSAGGNPSPTVASTVPSTTPVSAAGATTTTAAPAHPRGKSVLRAASVAVGGSAVFNDPKTGDPAVVVQPVAGTFAAFDTICPHEGCTVAYDAPARLFICPCHGSRFNGQTGALVQGPATRGLTRISIAEGPDGQLYAV